MTKSEAWQDQYLDLVRDDQSMEYLMKLGFEGRQRLSLTSAVAVNWGDPSLAVVFENMAKNTTSPGAAIQEYGSQFQAQMDDKWKGHNPDGYPINRRKDDRDEEGSMEKAGAVMASLVLLAGVMVLPASAAALSEDFEGFGSTDDLSMNWFPLW